MEIKRDSYLQQLINYMHDGQIKVITGIRRCGKSYLLNTLFKNYLLGQGTPPDNIISVELDLTKDIRYRDPLVLAEYVRSKVSGMSGKCYLFSFSANVVSVLWTDRVTPSITWVILFGVSA